jgi:hypothetical protein
VGSRRVVGFHHVAATVETPNMSDEHILALQQADKAREFTTEIVINPAEFMSTSAFSTRKPTAETVI